MDWRFDGSAADDHVEGSDKDNLFELGFGDDIAYGGDGDDTLFGGGGDDELYGDDGDDMLFGGSGDDELHGGDGADVFLYADRDGEDTIYDFEVGVDRIEFAGGLSLGGTDMGDGTLRIRYGGTLIFVHPTRSEALTLDDVLGPQIEVPSPPKEADV